LTTKKKRAGGKGENAVGIENNLSTKEEGEKGGVRKTTRVRDKTDNGKNRKKYVWLKRRGEI